MSVNDRILLAAADWHVRSQQDDMDWDAFTAWLEADADHRAAFDAVALDDAELSDRRTSIADALPSLPIADNDDAGGAANDDELMPAAPARWWRWAGGAGAAMAAAVAAALVLVPDASPPVPAAQQFLASASPKQLTLGNGVQVALSQGASLQVASDGSNEMTLKGVAFFNVPHRPDRTITIHAGGFDVVDLGTSFEIASTPQSIRVAVRDGTVAVHSPRLSSPLHLTAGQGMAALSGSNTIEQLRVPPANVGSFRTGQLVYDDVPLDIVAAELGQYTDAKIIVENDVGQRRFSGALSLGDRSALVNDVAALMDLQVHRDGNVVRLADGGGGGAR